MTDSPATIRDVARIAELSVASVSRALNGHSNVHPDTRQRVLDAVRTLGYIPNAAARSLSTARSHAIGVVLPDLHGEFFSELVRGMDKAASERGYMLLLSNMHADRNLAGQAMGAMRGRVDGVVVMAPQLGPGELAATLPAGIAAVLVNSQSDPGHHSLRIDNAAGVRTMIEHLVASGHRRIVHLAAMPGNLDGDERRDAYLGAMAELVPDVSPRVLDGDFSDTSGQQLTEQLLAEGAGFDAIFAANDMMALGAFAALRAAGIALPERIALAGFDDVPLARYLGLSTMHVDMVGLGGRAIERLIDEIEGKAGPAGIERFAPTLVVRATTGTS